MSYGTRIYSFPVFFDEMVRNMGWTRTQTAAAFSIGILIYGVLAPILGTLIPRIGIRPIMICGCLIGGIGFILLATTAELWQFYLYFGVMTFGMASMSTLPNNTTVSNWFVKRRSTALGIVSAGVGTGGVLMPLVARWLISIYNWETAFLVLAGVVIVIGIPIGAIVMRARPEDKGLLPDGELVSELLRAESNPAEAPAIDFNLRQAIRTVPFWLIGLGGLFYGWSYTIGLTHVVAFAVDVGIEKMAASGTVSLLCAFSIAGRLGFGRLGDIIDKRYVLMIGMALAGAAYVVLLMTADVVTLYIFSFILGLSIGAVAPLLPAIIADGFGTTHYGVIYGFSGLLLTTVGFAIGPVYGGWIFDLTGSYYIAFVTSIVLAFLALVSFYFVRQPIKR